MVADPSADNSALREELSLEQAVHSSDCEILRMAISNPALTEDLALSVLKRSDVGPQSLELLSKKPVAKNPKIRLALVMNHATPRHVSMALLSQLFTFDLMKVALTPVVAADLKVAAEQALIDRIEKLSPGEKLSLARRSFGQVAAALLLDLEPRVNRAALDNGRLTEAHLAKAVTMPKASAALIHAICEHPKWSVRRDLRAALLRSEKLPLSKAVEFAHGFPPAMVREILRNSRLPSGIKTVGTARNGRIESHVKDFATELLLRQGFSRRRECPVLRLRNQRPVRAASFSPNPFCRSNWTKV